MTITDITDQTRAGAVSFDSSAFERASVVEVNPGENWPRPEPLKVALPEPGPPPIDQAPVIIGDAVKALHDSTGANIHLCANAVNAAACYAAQGTHDVITPWDARRPLVDFYLSFATTNVRKTTTAAPLFGGRGIVGAADRDKQDSIRAAQETWDEQQRAYKADKKNSLPPDGPRPKNAVLILEDSTIEALPKAVTAWPSIAWATMEAGVILNGWNMKPDNRSAAMSSLNNIWDGDGFHRSRASDEGLAPRIYNRRVTVFWGTQQTDAINLYGDSEAMERGYLGRFSPVTATDTAPPECKQRPSLAESPAWQTFALECRRRIAMTSIEPAGGCNLGIIGPDDSARALYFDRIGPEHRDMISKVGSYPGATGEWTEIPGYGGKAHEKAVRTAARFALFRHQDSYSARDFQDGWAWARYHAEHVLYLAGVAPLEKYQPWKMRLFVKAADWMLNTWAGQWRNTFISATDVQRCGLPRKVRGGPGNDIHKEFVQFMAEHNFLRRPGNGDFRRQVRDGKGKVTARRDCYEINPLALC